MAKSKKEAAPETEDRADLIRQKETPGERDYMTLKDWQKNEPMRAQLRAALSSPAVKEAFKTLTHLFGPKSTPVIAIGGSAPNSADTMARLALSFQYCSGFLATEAALKNLTRVNTPAPHVQPFGELIPEE